MDVRRERKLLVARRLAAETARRERELARDYERAQKKAERLFLELRRAQESAWKAHHALKRAYEEVGGEA